MFALFTGIAYPMGGWKDLLDVYPTLAEAQKARDAINHDWYQIVDLTRISDSIAAIVEEG